MKTAISTFVLGAAALFASTSLSYAFEEGKLLVWVNGDKPYTALQAIGDKFKADLGIDVVVEHPEAFEDKFQQSAATNGGPDIILHAHDRFGEWAASGLIKPVDPSPDFKAKVLDVGWDAVTFDGKVWGYPLSVEAIGLIYNKALVSSPPKDFAEMADLQSKLPAGVSPIMWDYNNTYFTFPMLMSAGGYAFKKDANGSYDPKDTGVNSAGAKQGALVLKEMVDGGIMPKGLDYNTMDAAMNKGGTAMVINGPWAWGNLKTSGIDFGVAALPSIDGHPTPAFVGVQAFALNAASPNGDLAKEFIENYVLTEDGLKAMDADTPIGAATDKAYAESQKSDPNIAQTLANAEAGVPMPSTPAMGKFWAAMGPALTNITTDAQDVGPALDDAASRITAD
jgi:maltose/maltodextrin transport system substrate-binding protein